MPHYRPTVADLAALGEDAGGASKGDVDILRGEIAGGFGALTKVLLTD